MSHVLHLRDEADTTHPSTSLCSSLHCCHASSYTPSSASPSSAPSPAIHTAIRPLASSYSACAIVMRRKSSFMRASRRAAVVLQFRAAGRQCLRV